MLVALPPGHAARRRAGRADGELAGETWVSERRPDLQPAARARRRRRAGFTPRVAFASDDYGAVGRLVSAGVGVALVPALAAAIAGDCVELRRLEPAPARPLSVAVAPERSRGADAMLAVLKSASGRSTSSAPARASA